MFRWLTNRRRTQKKLAAELAAAIEQNRQALAVCERWAHLAAEQLALLAEARAENHLFAAALRAPRELQELIVAGCSEEQARVLAVAPRGSAN
ncbi:MAG: hypothetical protein ABR861_04910 [Terriglobales bacterium]|jgi:hypothetical protein